MRGGTIKIARRLRRKRGIRRTVRGTAERPRLTVFRSLKHIYAQVVDDDRGVTLCEASTRSKDLRDTVKYGGNREAAKLVGEALARLDSRAAELLREYACRPDRSEIGAMGWDERVVDGRFTFRMGDP